MPLLVTSPRDTISSTRSGTGDGPSSIARQARKTMPPVAKPDPEPSIKEQLQELGDMAIRLGEAHREVQDWVALQNNGLLPYDSPGWKDRIFAEEKFLRKLRTVTDALRAGKQGEKHG
jgi:hypothetical protein